MLEFLTCGIRGVPHVLRRCVSGQARVARWITATGVAGRGQSDRGCAAGLSWGGSSRPRRATQSSVSGPRLEDLGRPSTPACYWPALLGALLSALLQNAPPGCPDGASCRRMCWSAWWSGAVSIRRPSAFQALRSRLAKITGGVVPGQLSGRVHARPSHAVPVAGSVAGKAVGRDRASTARQRRGERKGVARCAGGAGALTE